MFYLQVISIDIDTYFSEKECTTNAKYDPDNGLCITNALFTRECC